VQLDAARTLVGWRWASSTLSPSQRGSARAWVALTDYPAARWTGRPFMSDTLASRTGAWDLSSRIWLDSVVRDTLGDPGLLGPVLPAGEVVGPLNSGRLQEASAVAPDAVVVAGGHDHPIGGSLVERLQPGAVLDSMGTAEVVVRAADRLDSALANADEEVSVSAGLLGHEATLLAVAELARNMSWAGHSGQAVQDGLEELLKGTTELPMDPGLANLFIPGGQGGQFPSWAPEARSATPMERAAAALIACAANGWRIVELLHPAADAAVFVAGGWTRSPGWMAVKRRFSARSVNVIPEPEVTAVGAALIAGDALGWSQDPATALGYSTTSSVT
jgi:sugar (pentulose or hexulose) kinase